MIARNQIRIEIKFVNGQSIIPFIEKKYNCELC
jgi:hypothetical protein